MKFRNFLFLNTKVIEYYNATVNGHIYDEESQVIATSNEKWEIRRLFDFPCT